MSASVSAPVRLVRFRSEPREAAVLLDIDGTLAPIVERPEDAAVPEETRNEVERLAGRYALVACISGRPAADARRIVGLDGIEYIGVHGLEGHPGVPEYTPQLERLVESADWPWRVETKAGVTAAFHYREVNDEEAAEAVERVVETAEALGLAVQRGRKVVEVKPPIDADKGTAARALLEERGIASRALRRRRHDRPRRLPRPRRGRAGRGRQGRGRVTGDEPEAAHRGRPGRGRPR